MGIRNQPISEEIFSNLYNKVLDYLKEKNEVFVFKGFAGADKKHRLPIQVINEFAWHNLICPSVIYPSFRRRAIRIMRQVLLSFLHPHFKADPSLMVRISETFIIISFEQRTVLIGGTEYAGEMKKSIFSIMNYLLPEKRNSIHALFF